MAVISSGQITIIDLFDAPVLNAWVAGALTTTQTYNATSLTWSPSYASTAQTLTLSLTRAGSATSVTSGINTAGVKWYKTVGATKTEITSTTSTDSEYKSGTKNVTLTTKVNVPAAQSQVIYSAEGVYDDPDTGMPVSFAAQIPITLVQLAKATVIGTVTTPDGDIFRNKMPASLKVNADLFKEGSLSAGSKKIKWFAADTSVGTSQDTDGGVGWRKITATTGTTGAVANSTFDAAVTTQGVLTVYPDAVASAQTFKAVITDNAGGTSGTKVQGFATIKDLDDPVMVVVESSGGDVLKNGVGTTTLRARLFQNGDEIDTAGTAHTYKWTRWQNNSMDTTWGTAGAKTGKEVGVGPVDVDVKTMFKCEVSK